MIFTPTVMTRRASGLFARDPGEALILPEQSFGLRSNCVATLCRAKSGTPLKQWTFHNKLVNVLMDAIMTNTAGFPGVNVETDSANFFAAGTGTTPPVAGDTALGAEITLGGRGTTTTTLATYQAGPPDYCLNVRRATFSTSQANGTIGEFGYFGASSGAPMRARAVPTDNTGTQTTIIKNSSNTLILDWTIQCLYLQADAVLNRTIGGTNYAITTRAIGANTSTPASYFLFSRGPNWGTGFAHGARTQSALVARTGSATSGTGIAATAVSAYVNGSFVRSTTFTTINAMAAMAFLTNAGGTSSDTFCTVQMGFSPAIVGAQPLIVKISLIPL